MSEQLYYGIQLMFLAAVLVPASLWDIKTKTISNWVPFSLLVGKIILFLLLLALWWRKKHEINGFFTSMAYDEFFTTAVGLILALLILVPCRLLVKEGLGMGDVKLLVALAVYLGATLFLRALALMSLIALLITGVLLATKRITREESLPFAPFISVGAALSCLIRII